MLDAQAEAEARRAAAPPPLRTGQRMLLIGQRHSAGWAGSTEEQEVTVLGLAKGAPPQPADWQQKWRVAMAGGEERTVARMWLQRRPGRGQERGAHDAHGKRSRAARVQRDERPRAERRGGGGCGGVSHCEGARCTERHEHDAELIAEVHSACCSSLGPRRGKRWRRCCGGCECSRRGPGPSKARVKRALSKARKRHADGGAQARAVAYNAGSINSARFS